MTNILMIMTDQQRADSLGCYGADFVETPNLDRLAGRGVRFDNCIVNNPICTPSRACIMTGRELPGHGVYRLHDAMPQEIGLFPDRLRREADLRTALFGKLHASGRMEEERRRHPRDGFEVYEWSIEACVALDSPYNGYAPWLRDRDPAFLADLTARGRQLKHHAEEVHFTRWAAERAIGFVKDKAARRQPFFCKLSLFDPHNPYDLWPKTMERRVDRARIPPPLPAIPSPACVERERAGSYAGVGFSAEEIEDMRFGYAASVAFVDQEVGRVLDTLEAEGLADDTLVIFTSDHGDSLGDHGLMVKGAALHEHVIRVPMIVAWPGHVPEGVASTALVQPHDIARTCCEAAGLAWADGDRFATSRNLVEIANGAPSRPYAVCAFRNSGINSANLYWDPPMASTAVRSENAKLVAYSGEGTTEYQFFDLAADPDEQVDRFADPACAGPVRAHMTALVDWLQAEGLELGCREGAKPPAGAKAMVNALKA